MIKTPYSILKQTKENPLNWILISILYYVLQSYSKKEQRKRLYRQTPKHPNVMVFKNYTPIDLLSFKENPILMAVNGYIYDVTRQKHLYGPGGPYANFAGHDASRGLAKNSSDIDMFVDPNGPIDSLEDLTDEEWDVLREWEKHFAIKYLFVGNFIENQ